MVSTGDSNSVSRLIPWICPWAEIHGTERLSTDSILLITPSPASPTMPDSEEPRSDLAQRLVSEDARVREPAWDELLGTLIPRIERRVGHKLASAPPRVRQGLEDIKSKTLEVLVESLCRSKPVISVERFALGIADNLCRRALDQSRDREQGRGGEGYEQDAIRSNKSPTGSTFLQAKEIRNVIRRGLTRFRNELETTAKEARPGLRTKAPVLQFMAVDMAMQGQGKPGHLITATGFEAHTITRLRDAAIRALAESIGPVPSGFSSTVGDADLDLAWSDLGDGTPLADHWSEYSIGCCNLEPPFERSHPSHREDLEKYAEVHTKLCLDCQPLSEPTLTEIESWKSLAEESLARSRTD